MNILSNCTICAIIFLVFFSAEQSFGQLTKYYKVREWSDATGKFKKQAQLVSANRDQVVIEYEDGNRATIPFGSLSNSDKGYLEEFMQDAFRKLTGEARECVYAHEVLKLYEQYESDGLVGPSNQILVESRIATLKQQAEIQSIVFLEGFVPEKDLPAKKDATRQMVDSWISDIGLEGDAESDQKLLREAINGDPTSLDAAIILALYFEVHNGEYDIAQRHLDDAVKNGIRYLPVATANDKANLVTALNNLAVSFARINRISKALKLWMKANEVAEFQLPAPVKNNIAKVARMVSTNYSGMSADGSTMKDLEKFITETGSTGKVGGWMLICPKDSAGGTRNNLPFVIAKGYSQISDDTIEDRRCVKCDGTSAIRCLNKRCRNGTVSNEVYGRKIIQTARGPIDAGYGLIRVDKLKCSNCSGDGIIDCPCCTRGVQNN